MTRGKQDKAKVGKDKRNKAVNGGGGRGGPLGSQAERQMRNPISDGAHVKPAPFHHSV